MKNLFAILKKPNRLDEFAEDNENKLSIWNDTRRQINFLHKIGITYVIIACFLIALSSIFLGIPAVFEDSPESVLIGQFLMTYICICIISNFIMIFYFAKKSHFGFGNCKELPFSSLNKMREPDWSSQEINNAENEHLQSDWTKCHHCDMDVPPRARHCSICQTCVLKKDHHCFFTGCCIGFYNQRFFITFCFFGMVGGIWGIYNFGTYLGINYAPFLSLQLYKYFLPYCVVTVLLGFTTFSSFGLVLLFYIHMTCTATVIYYFWWQLFIISRGQTSYDFVKRRKIYDSNLWLNVRSVFGRYWFIGFLIPLPVIVNEGDGMSWKINTKSD